MPIDLGGTALPQHCQAGSVALFFSLFFFSGPPFLIGRLQAENILDFVQTEKGRAWKCAIRAVRPRRLWRPHNEA